MSGEGFLGRWSRLKRTQVKATPSVPAIGPAAEPAEPPNLPAKQKEAGTEKPVVRAEDLPPIDGLTMESDISAFLKEGVPDELKNLALRKVWASDPFLAKPDPLDIHNLDYTMPILTEAVKTVYQVGRGIVLPEDEKPVAAKPGESEAMPASTATAVSAEAPAELPPAEASDTPIAIASEPGAVADPVKPG